MITLHMFVGGGLIPFYLLVRDLGMINTRWSLIIPGALSVWNMVVLRTSMEGVPDSLEESARLDGASDMTILTKIILPLIKPALAVQVLFYAVTAWNSWFNASMLGINFSDTMNVARYMALTKYCIVIIATVPILVIYPAYLCLADASGDDWINVCNDQWKYNDAGKTTDVHSSCKRKSEAP